MAPNYIKTEANTSVTYAAETGWNLTVSEGNFGFRILKEVIVEQKALGKTKLTMSFDKATSDAFKAARWVQIEYVEGASWTTIYATNPTSFPEKDGIYYAEIDLTKVSTEHDIRFTIMPDFTAFVISSIEFTA